MHRSLASIPAGLAAVALLAGCPAREVAEVQPKPTKEELKDIPVEINRDIDILFVIDNSGSMAEEQASLTANFSRFINVLQNIDGGLPNVHIGVVSSDLGAGPFNIAGCTGSGDNGTLQSAPRVPGCSPPSGAFIRDVAMPDGTRSTNYTGTLADTFTCIARLGINGCGFEQHLESMRRALNGSNPANAGFLRPSAFLAVILIADEDDCSAENTAMFDTSQNSVTDPLGPLASYRCTEFGVVCDPDTPRVPGPRQNCTSREDSQYMFAVQQYVDFLKSLKDDPRMVIVAGIIGNPTPVVVGLDAMNRPRLEPSCSTPGAGEADPGIRFKYLLDQFPDRNTVTTICNEDLSDALIVIAELLKRVIGNPCIDSNILDAQGNYECQVSDVRFPGEDRQEETILPECNDARSNIPCWHLELDREACPTTPTGLTLVVERGGGSVLTGTHVQARCVAH
jgi:hypothetical protein